MLIEHCSNDIRYVGQTVTTLSRRLYLHCFFGPNGTDRTDHRTRWLQQQIRRGTPPRIELVQTLPSTELDTAEKYWIAYYKSIGCPLVNTHVGGNGGWDAVNDRPSKLKGRPKSPEARAKISAALKGRKLSAATKAKMSAARQRDKARISEQVKLAWKEGRCYNQWTAKNQ